MHSVSSGTPRRTATDRVTANSCWRILAFRFFDCARRIFQFCVVQRHISSASQPRHGRHCPVLCLRPPGADLPIPQPRCLSRTCHIHGDRSVRRPVLGDAKLGVAVEALHLVRAHLAIRRRAGPEPGDPLSPAGAIRRAPGLQPHAAVVGAVIGRALHHRKSGARLVPADPPHRPRPVSDLPGKDAGRPGHSRL